MLVLLALMERTLVALAVVQRVPVDVGRLGLVVLGPVVRDRVVLVLVLDPGGVGGLRLGRRLRGGLGGGGRLLRSRPSYW
ncbi:hypothetical protein EV650_6845 [Kribbella kalugense]|uniref:Uncharacterized protein n=1 Tax=Kribbella kalugense TaxID=2512221 RepID=A0A4R7ZCR8_9ACTN|nr:hypothetical protein EV650_6845 [Kribbella kalugense]